MVSRSSLISLDVLDVILNPSVAVVDVCVCVCFFLIDLSAFKHWWVFDPVNYYYCRGETKGQLFKRGLASV